MKAVSVAGIFKRRMGEDGRPRIYEADLSEISVTPFPVNPRALFTVAQKAFENEPDPDPGAEPEQRARAAGYLEVAERIAAAHRQLDELENRLA
jgi:hypothetical protein